MAYSKKDRQEYYQRTHISSQCRIHNKMKQLRAERDLTPYKGIKENEIVIFSNEERMAMKESSFFKGLCMHLTSPSEYPFYQKSELR